MSEPPLARMRIDLGYDGGPYRGFARQQDVPTVQAHLEDHLERVYDQKIVSVCAGRTDAGVHALGQVIHFDVMPTARAERAMIRMDDDPSDFRLQLDHQGGDEITVWSAGRVNRSFNARFSAYERRYRYVLSDTPGADPRMHRVQWQQRHRVDVEAMHEAGQLLLGEQDYAAFCRVATGGHTRRRLDQVSVRRTDEDLIHIDLRGPAFCHQLCRAITGCLVEVGRGEQPAAWVGEVLRARDRALAAPVSPPQGLTLMGIGYRDPYPDAPLRLP